MEETFIQESQAGKSSILQNYGPEFGTSKKKLKLLHSESPPLVAEVHDGI
jgi:hypothetical protein